MPLMPTNISKNQLLNPNSWISANQRLFRVEKNQDNATDYKQATTTDVQPNKNQYTVNTGDVIPKLDDIVVQAESFMLEIDELIFDWSLHHAENYERSLKSFVPPNQIQSI